MRVTYVNGDDWCGLYRNGRLYDENHSLSARDILLAIANQGNIHFTYIEVDQRWLEDQGHLPANLGDIPQEVRTTCD